jgi:hypothetical protein
LLDLLGSTLGDLPVLTVETSEVTSTDSDRERRGGREEVEQWLLLDGINMDRARIPITVGIKASVMVLPDPTDAALAWREDTAMRAQVAGDLATCCLDIEARFLQTWNGSACW